MIFVDANIPMYLIGAEHPHRERVRQLLEAAIARRERLVTDVEVLQEVLHRYAAIGRLEAVQPAFDAVEGLVDEIFSVDHSDLEAAKNVLLGDPRRSVRDALHLAVMRRHEVATILTFDRGFDGISGILRLY